MDRIITRLEQLIKYCSSSSSKYSECIYEIDGLALSIAGKIAIFTKIYAVYIRVVFMTLKRCLI